MFPHKKWPNYIDFDFTKCRICYVLLNCGIETSRNEIRMITDLDCVYISIQFISSEHLKTCIQTINPCISNSLYRHIFLINHYCLFVCLFTKQILEKFTVEDTKKHIVGLTHDKATPRWYLMLYILLYIQSCIRINLVTGKFHIWIYSFQQNYFCYCIDT